MHVYDFSSPHTSDVRSCCIRIIKYLLHMQIHIYVYIYVCRCCYPAHTNAEKVQYNLFSNLCNFPMNNFKGQLEHCMLYIICTRCVIQRLWLTTQLVFHHSAPGSDPLVILAVDHFSRLEVVAWLTWNNRLGVVRVFAIVGNVLHLHFPIYDPWGIAGCEGWGNIQRKGYDKEEQEASPPEIPSRFPVAISRSRRRTRIGVDFSTTLPVTSVFHFHFQAHIMHFFMAMESLIKYSSFVVCHDFGESLGFEAEVLLDRRIIYF